jgi:hypothetical protein
MTPDRIWEELKAAITRCRAEQSPEARRNLIRWQARLKHALSEGN